MAWITLRLGRLKIDFSCQRCGDFGVSRPLSKEFEYIPADVRPYLSIAIRQAHEANKQLVLNTNNWKQLAELPRATRVAAKLEGVLAITGRKAGGPGGSCPINIAMDYPLFSSTGPAELKAYLAHLQMEGLLSGPAELGVDGNYAPSIKGWQRIEPIYSPGGEPDRCFVAMWFADDLDFVYESGFSKAISQCGFKPYRVKEDPINKSVIDKILAEIRRAHFVVADFTGQRQSVYYEAGFAHGIGREVISCCREGETEGLSFDTRHLGHIVWKDATELAEKLANSIQANILPKS